MGVGSGGGWGGGGGGGRGAQGAPRNGQHLQIINKININHINHADLRTICDTLNNYIPLRKFSTIYNDTNLFNVLCCTDLQFISANKRRRNFFEPPIFFFCFPCHCVIITSHLKNTGIGTRGHRDQDPLPFEALFINTTQEWYPPKPILYTWGVGSKWIICYRRLF